MESFHRRFNKSKRSNQFVIPVDNKTNANSICFVAFLSRSIERGVDLNARTFESVGESRLGSVDALRADRRQSERLERRESPGGAQDRASCDDNAYCVWRADSGSALFAFLDAVKRRRPTDSALPAAYARPSRRRAAIPKDALQLAAPTLEEARKLRTPRLPINKI